MDTILKHQGVGWIVRSAIGYATITIIVKHYKDEAGIEHIDIDQSLSGGVGASNERRTMDWTYRETQDNIFGAVKGKSRRIKVEDIQDEYLQKGWLPDVLEHGAINSYVESDTEKSKKHWIAEQVRNIPNLEGRRLISCRFGDSKRLAARDVTSDTSSSKAMRTARI